MDGLVITFHEYILHAPPEPVVAVLLIKLESFITKEPLVLTAPPIVPLLEVKLHPVIVDW